ncbi:MAG: hypothetical protein J2P18_07195 [Nocardia sp.]|nr:hypothetical protein [Nocardia sp.]
MLDDAAAGRINVRMDLEQFVYLDRDCQTFLDTIKQIKVLADRVGRMDTWGLGEHSRTPDGKTLVSGATLVHRFRTKAGQSTDTDGNSVCAIMNAHQRAVEDIQETYRRIRKNITDQDADAAARYAQLEKTLPQQPPVNPAPFSIPCKP